jgi:hypothetical protein
MKATLAALAVAAALVAAAALSGCALFGTSKAERVLRFQTDLNESRQYAYQNFDPAIGDYLSLSTQNPNYTWDEWFPPADWPDTTQYRITVQDTAGDSLTATVEGPVDFGGPRTLTIGVVRLGLDWYINRLELSGHLPPLIVQ